jgi:ATP-binding cassette subfamily B (MDR/TAP) protein 1
MNVHHLRRLFGVVSQEPVLFDGTLEENIRLGLQDATPQQIQDALTLANAKTFVDALPDGVSETWERVHAHTHVRTQV